MKMRTRVFKGISGMILMLAIGLGTLNQTVAQCTVEVFATVNPGNCFSQVAISSTASEPVQSWTYYIDGNIVGSNSPALVQLGPGTYVASVVVITTQNCTAVDDFSFTVGGTQVTVDAGADYVACQETPLLSVSVNSPNPYSLQWTPAYLLSDASSATPQVTQNVTNQWFIVDVIDDVTGCIYSDTITITQQNPLFDSLSLCNGPVTIDLGPGALWYQWLSWTDTAGNNQQLNYPSTQQAITVTEPGQYFMYADFPECGALTSLVTVEECNTSCWNLFSYVTGAVQCGTEYQFVSTSSMQGIIHNWDFGDGTTSNEAHPIHVFSAGTYTVTLTVFDINQCTSVSTQTITVGGLSVDINEDIIACAGQLMLFCGATGGSGNYAYSWTPTVLMTSPTSQNTVMNVQGNQWVHVTVYDTQNQCSATDSVYVYANQPINVMMELCNGTVPLVVDPGSLVYGWSYTDLQGNTSTISNAGNSYIATQVGTYTVMTYYSGCQQVFHTFEVLPCPSNCTSAITSTLNYQNCGALVNFVSSYSSAIDSAVWNLGNGNTYVQYGAQPAPQEFYTGGNYVVSLTAYHTSGCVSTTGYGITLLTDIVAEINAPDTIACAGQVFLNATATGGGGQFAYFWPLSGGTTPNAVLVVSQNQWVVVEVTDTYTGCTAFDSIYVYANQANIETVQMCQSSVPLIVNLGSMVYNWSYTDQSGNTTQLPNQTNELEAFNLGTYTCMTYYSGCQQVFHTFEVVLCGTVCSVEFISVPNPTACGMVYDFAAQNFSSPVDSVMWDYGNGIFSSMESSQFYTAGTYEVTLTAYHTSGCVSTFSQTLTVNSGIAIELVQDTLACNGTLFLSHTISGGSGNYMYQWSPAVAMNNPTAANPTMTVTTDGWVEVYLIDTQQGCVATDSMFVYANAAINETLELCSNNVLLQVAPGSMVYNWSFTDAFGNNNQIQNFGNELLANEVGTYICFTYYSGCNGITHSFVVEECAPQNDDVWPGDANSDGVVTNSDALYLGLAFNQTGPNRPAATLNWVGQPCPDWTFNFAVNNVNLKHADCDGNGIINFDDTLAIDFNYLNTHNKFEGVTSGGNPPIWVEASPDTVGLQQAIEIIVYLGTAAQPIDSLHGVAFSLTFDESLLTQNGLSIDFDNCALGTAGNDVISFQKNLFNDGMIDVAVSRNTLEDFQGYGPIVHVRIVTTDNLSGIHNVALGIGGVVALTASETTVELTAIGDTVVIDPNKVGIDEAALDNVSVYPNPTTDVLNISGLEGTGTISIYNAVGQEAMTVPFSNSDRMKLNLSELVSGVYLVKIRSEKGVVTHKLRLIQS
ncbi:MAG: T9SS type A sorting domain-containing protein [Flavobacteriales bacterium]|nr:T9SS type A sorting domain-containing protein [Flavobacteriales bacterium]